MVTYSDGDRHRGGIKAINQIGEAASMEAFEFGKMIVG
jgi:hypothetical protein